MIESIAITPAAAQIVPGGTQQYVATATLGDGTTQVVTALATWVSVDPAIATVSSAGLATGVAVGTTTLRATLQSITGEAPLVVLGPAVSRIQPSAYPSGIQWLAMMGRAAGLFWIHLMNAPAAPVALPRVTS